MSRKYRHVAWYSLFVAAYMVVLYLQVGLRGEGPKEALSHGLAFVEPAYFAWAYTLRATDIGPSVPLHALCSVFTPVAPLSDEQASAYKSTEVVQTLKDAFMPAGATGSTVTFKSENDVLNYIGTQILLPIWKDPICGDGNCEWPWEFPAWGPFGCRAGAWGGLWVHGGFLHSVILRVPVCVNPSVLVGVLPFGIPSCPSITTSSPPQIAAQMTTRPRWS